MRTRNYGNQPNMALKGEEVTGSSIPFYENQDDSLLAAIFPEELWLMILLDNVGTKSKNGTDNLTNVSLASPYFRKILDGQRKYFLFPKVLETLTTWLEDQEAKIITNNGDGRNNLDSERRAGNFTSLPMYKMTDILICRELCSGWNKVFENFYQNPKRYAQMQHDAVVKFSRNLGEIKMRYEEEEEDGAIAILNPRRHPLSFLNHFKVTHERPSKKGHPFSGRSIKFGNVQLEDFGLLEPQQQLFGQGISQILIIFGEHLWHCDMELSDLNFFNRNNFYHKLKMWLTQMPNLKTLKLNCYHIFESEQMEIIDEILDGMQRYVSRNPIPELKMLQFLQVRNLAPVVFNELVRASAQSLTQLEITRRQEACNAIDYDIYSEANSLVQLNELSLEFCSVEHFERMEKSLVAANWKLEKFYFLYEENADFLDWSRVFQMINKNWSRTITNLVLQMPVTKTDMDKNLCLEASLSRTVIQLPNLKRVKLIIKNPCSLDFLLPSSNTLECMEIIADYNIDEEKGKRYYRMIQERQYVKFLGFENSESLFISNILDRFPKLNFVKIVTLLNREEVEGKYWYRFCVYEAGKIKSEDRLECPKNA